MIKSFWRNKFFWRIQSFTLEDSIFSKNSILHIERSNPPEGFNPSHIGRSNLSEGDNPFLIADAKILYST